MNQEKRVMDKQDFLNKFPHVEQGMTVYSREGEKLGKLVQADEYSLTIEKGFFFPKDFTFSYDDVEDVAGGEIIMNTHRTDLEPWRNDRYEGWNEIERANEGDDVRMQLREEKLDVEKTQRSAGRMRLRKVVHTELKNITVPVSKEEVIVERVPASEARDTHSDDAFREQEISMPIREEEIEIHKRPVLKEEVRLSKQTHTEQHKLSDEVRREDVEIEREHDYKPKKH
jgi:uncharacterized protein (TIGR02271 family)